MRISFGDGFVFDTEQRVLDHGRMRVRLSPKAFAILEVLVTECPRAVAKRELLDRVWPDVVVEEQNVKNAIFELRAALGESAPCIRTVQRFGYAFTAERGSPTSARLLASDRTYALVDGENFIGRDLDCAVMLNESGVSRQHARVRITNGRAVLDDLQSKNGTFLNGKRISAAVDLADGDEIAIGHAQLIFRSAPRAGTTTTLG